MRRRRPAPAEPDATPTPPDVDQAWKALSLVNDWVKHADAKLGVVLTAAGVSGGVLFNLVQDRSDTSTGFDTAAFICAASVLVASACAMIGVYPRVRLGRKTTDVAVNPLFFHDVARAYKRDAPSYGAVLHTLTTNPDDLVRHISQQTHANATVAQRKFRWADRGIRALVLDLLALGALAMIIALKR